MPQLRRVLPETRFSAGSPGLNSDWVNSPMRLHTADPAPNRAPVLKACEPRLALRLSCGYIFATETPYSALAACRRDSAAWMSGRRRTSSDGRTRGSSTGRVNSSRVKVGRPRLPAPGRRARPADVRSAGLVTQQRYVGARLFHSCLQVENLVRGRIAEPHAFPGQMQLFVLGGKDGLDGLELAGKPGLGDRRGRDGGSQVESRAFKFVVPVFGSGGQGLQSTPFATGQIRLVACDDAGTVQIEIMRVAFLPLRAGIQTLALGSEVGVDLGIMRRSCLRRLDLLRLPQRGLGCRQRRAALKCLFDKRVERWRAQILPPLRAHVGARVEPLCFSQRRRRGDRLLRHGCGGVALHGGGAGRLKSGPLAQPASIPVRTSAASVRSGTPAALAGANKREGKFTRFSRVCVVGSRESTSSPRSSWVTPSRMW